MERNNAGLSEQIFINYKPKIFGYIISKSVPLSDRDDVFNEILVKAVSQAHQYDSAKSSLSTWVYIITRSVVADYYRKRKVEYPLTVSLTDDTNLETQIEYEEELKELAKQLTLLPQRERQVIILRLYKDMDYAEIAKTINLSEGNARVIYSRAIKKLKTLMT